ncbi:phage tail tube protein [Rhodocyclus tenuis]|uniref:Uncharacterized protein n=1 Tax=Rhodocyclus tenuis TaxID=1066 RepID=A0A840G5R1_RHOTE|nr:hypothetical protein [Rhodocyclus tenuis]MBB4247246.1 hypothetical protein [Rhodocyclus tenuis]
MSTLYYSGAGYIWIGQRGPDGKPLWLMDIGDTGEYKVSLNVDTEEVQEDQTGDRLTAVRLQTAKKAGLSMQAKNWSKDNLAMVTYGTVLSQGTGTVSGETLPNPSAVGALALLAKQNVSSVIVVDSTGTPKTLPAGQYTVNGPGGSIQLKDKTAGGPYVEPFKASYSYADASVIPMFSGEAKEYWVRFEGRNTVPGGGRMIVDLYRVVLDPAATLDFITRQVANFPIAGSVLRDDTKVGDAVLGQFGRIIQVAA